MEDWNFIFTYLRTEILLTEKVVSPGDLGINTLHGCHWDIMVDCDELKGNEEDT